MKHVLAVPPQEKGVTKFMNKPSHGVRAITKVVVIVTGQNLDTHGPTEGIQAGDFGGHGRAEVSVWKMDKPDTPAGILIRDKPGAGLAIIPDCHSFCEAFGQIDWSIGRVTYSNGYGEGGPVSDDLVKIGSGEILKQFQEAAIFR